MPKIIEGLPEKIVSAAKESFEKYGYEGVDMELIAQRVGIAVGTIYNYYSNKSELFLATLKLSWKELEDQLEESCAVDDPLLRLRQTLKIYYRFIERKRGLWKEMIQVHIREGRTPPQPKELKGLDQIEDLVARVTGEVDSFESENPRRIAVSLLMTIFGLLREFPESDQENLEYLMELVDRQLD